MAQSVRLSDDLYKIAKTRSKAEHRSIAGQIEYWAKLGRIIKDNPELTLDFVEGILISEAELEQGQVSEFHFE